MSFFKPTIFICRKISRSLRGIFFFFLCPLSCFCLVVILRCCVSPSHLTSATETRNISSILLPILRVFFYCGNYVYVNKKINGNFNYLMRFSDESLCVLCINNCENSFFSWNFNGGRINFLKTQQRNFLIV